MPTPAAQTGSVIGAFPARGTPAEVAAIARNAAEVVNRDPTSAKSPQVCRTTCPRLMSRAVWASVGCWSRIRGPENLANSTQIIDRHADA